MLEKRTFQTAVYLCVGAWCTVDYEEIALPECMKCGMAFPWHGDESPCNTLCQLPDAFAVCNKKWHSFSTNCTQVIPSLCVLYLCVLYILLLVKHRGLMFLRSQMYLPPLGLRGSGGLGWAVPEEHRCHGHSADGHWPDLMLHEQFPSIQLLPCAVEWPRQSTMCV